ncbi:MAG: glutathione peroxidase [Proteobacteria bacterium]|nr:glutathione peroxidase [Pseudomonadota bacterium]MCP4921458.1 glutathione peroxidase [Pseudomonadota bacterium]
MQLTQLDGTPLPAEVLEGRVVLFVNVASKCGFTPQYTGLQSLFEEYEDRGLVLVGVPCNQFGKQEPGSSEEIASFCSLNYGVEFPLLEKQDVNGPDRSPLYDRLIDSDVGGGAKVQWNFEKFLVGRDGTVRNRFGSRTAPEDAELRAAIEAALVR